MTNLMDRLIDL
jgi:hypothetical protein